MPGSRRWFDASGAALDLLSATPVPLTPSAVSRHPVTPQPTDQPATAAGGTLGRGDTSRALSSFIAASGLWGAWGQCVGIGTAVFTGFALHLGADESYIALFTSVAYLLAVAQLISPILGQRISRHKPFIIAVGFIEISFRCCPVLIPLVLAPSMHLGALLVLVGLGLLAGYSLSPFYTTWIANTVPEGIRARFTGRQTIISTVVAMAVGFIVGRFLDFFPEGEKQVGFQWVYGAGLLFGCLGYVVLGRAPYPPRPPDDEPQVGSGRLLLEPYRNANFRRALLFYGLWIFAVGVAGPLYSVFMLQRLEISYTVISVFNALFMVTSIGGYRFWSGFVDRFGSKPVLQILLVPASLIPVLWVFNGPGAYYLVPVALALSGLLFSGITVAITPMLYGLVPAGARRPYYLATWSASVNLLGALGPLTGSFLAWHWRDVVVVVGGFSLENLRLIFLVSSVTRLIPIFLLHFVRDRSTLTSRRLLSNMLRGNFLSYTYNAAVYSLATGEERRARAALALGRSGSPLAIEQLIQALSDASPVVRRSAARALGETRSEEATDPLIKELINGESDIRPEAAEALGRLGHRGSIDHLIEALEDGDPRVRISAIRGLWEIGGPEVQELLFWYFGGRFDPVTFPTLVDVLSRMGDYRVIKSALDRLKDFNSGAVRLQLLNSVCRALGAKGEFYRLLSLEETRLASAISRLLRRARATFGRSAALDAAVREELDRTLDRIRRAYDSENSDWLEESVQQAAGIIRDGLTATGRRPFEVLSIYLVILAINSFLASEGRHGLGAASEIFLAVAIEQISVLVKRLEIPQDGTDAPPEDLDE